MRLAMILFFLCTPVLCFAERQNHIRCRGEFCSITEIGANADEVQQVANIFEQEIVEKLQTGSFQVLNPKVDLWTWIEKGDRWFEIRYSVRVVPTDAESAVRHFARLGTLVFGSTQSAVKDIAEKENVKKRLQLRASCLAREVCSYDLTGNSEEGYWFVEECFISGK